MLNKIFNKETAEKVAGYFVTGCKVVVPFIGMTLIGKMSEINTTNSNKFYRYADYGDAVEAVIESDLIGSYKKEIIDMLDKNGTIEYYRSVITIINSDLIGSYKKEMIANLTKEA